MRVGETCVNCDCRLTEVPVHVDVGDERRRQAVDRSHDGCDDDKGTHPEYDCQSSLLLQCKAGFENGRNANREKQDVRRDIEDGVDNLIVLVGGALNFEALANQAYSSRIVRHTVRRRDSPVLLDRSTDRE